MRIAPQIPIFRPDQSITLEAGLFHWGPENYTYVDVGSKTVRLHMAPQSVVRLGIKALIIASPILAKVASLFIRESFLAKVLKVSALVFSFIPLICLIQARINYLNRRGVEFTLVEDQQPPTEPPPHQYATSTLREPPSATAAEPPPQQYATSTLREPPSTTAAEPPSQQYATSTLREPPSATAEEPPPPLYATSNLSEPPSATAEEPPSYEPVRLVAPSSRRAVLQPIYDQLYELDRVYCQHGNQVDSHLSSAQRQWLDSLVDSPDRWGKMGTVLPALLKELYTFFKAAEEKDFSLLIKELPSTSPTLKELMKAVTLVSFLKVNETVSQVIELPDQSQVLAAWLTFLDYKSIQKRINVIPNNFKNIFEQMDEQAKSIKQNESDLGKWNRYLENKARIDAWIKASIFGNDPDKLLKTLKVNKKQTWFTAFFR